jgi:hypothetical protein
MAILSNNDCFPVLFLIPISGTLRYNSYIGSGLFPVFGMVKKQNNEFLIGPKTEADNHMIHDHY